MMITETIKLNENSILKRKEEARFRVSDFLIVLFWIVYLFVRLWIADSENLSEAYKAVMVVPYINKNTGTIMLLLTCLILGCLFLLNRLKFDNIFPAFLLRIVLYFIPVLYLEGDFQYGIAFAIIQTMLAYYIGYNYKGKLNIIINILIVATLILLGQIFYVIIYNNLSIFENTKYFMRLPGGQTNYLGVFLVASYILVDLFYSNSKNFFKYVYLGLIWVGVWCVGTRSGLLILVGYYCFKWGRTFYRNLKQKNIWEKKRKHFLLKTLFIIIICCFFGIFFFLIKDEILYRLSAFTVEGMTTNRLQVYADVVELIFQHPILGRSAYSYIAFDTKYSHNFLLESLNQTGIIGTCIYLLIWGYCFKKISKIREEKIRFLFQIFILITLIHGSVEPNLFSIISDTFVWFLLGIGCGYSNRLKDKR